MRKSLRGGNLHYPSEKVACFFDFTFSNFRNLPLPGGSYLTVIFSLKTPKVGEQILWAFPIYTIGFTKQNHGVIWTKTKVDNARSRPKLIETSSGLLCQCLECVFTKTIHFKPIVPFRH